MTVHVRPATKADEPDVLELAHRLEEGVAPWRGKAGVTEAIRGWIAGSIGSIGDQGHACFVAEANGQVIGFVSVSESSHWSGDKDAHLGELMVSKHAERRGIGRALVEEAVLWGRARGCQRIALETGAANVAGRKFYESMAFETEEVRLSRAL